MPLAKWISTVDNYEKGKAEELEYFRDLELQRIVSVDKGARVPQRRGTGDSSRLMP